jgi:hypothetical protein
MKKLASILILCAATLSLSGCAILNFGPPCYGVGCPALGLSKSGQDQKNTAQNAPAQNGASAQIQPDRGQ